MNVHNIGVPLILDTLNSGRYELLSWLINHIYTKTTLYDTYMDSTSICTDRRVLRNVINQRNVLRLLESKSNVDRIINENYCYFHRREVVWQCF